MNSLKYHDPDSSPYTLVLTIIPISYKKESFKKVFLIVQFL